MSPDDFNRTVPRQAAPEQTADHLPADDTGSRAADESSNDPNRTVPRPSAETPSAADTIVRTPTDVARQEASAEAAEVVPGYVILGKLGAGGMGVVYKARHTKLNRIVALKMMLGEHAGRGELIRFLAEAEAIATIKHENVVQVFDYGETNCRPYMALEFCPGGTLIRLFAQHRKSPDSTARDAAKLLSQVSRGVAAAHAQGIVHRDLKPGNVFLDEAGAPKVADFGLAKRGGGEDVTQTGQVMGTPAYMSPEQAKGETKFVGPQADVWALGVMFYESLTGVRPFTGSVQEILATLQNAEPVAPRKVVASIPRDLELICLKCLAKAPHERYSTAKELADDLDRYLRGEPITVRPAGVAEHVVKWVRRKPTAAAAYGFSTLAIALALVVFVVFGFWREAEGARSEAERQRGIADEARADVERKKAKLDLVEYGRTIQIAHQECRNNNQAGARAYLDATDTQFRKWEWHYVNHLANWGLLCTLEGHTKSVFSASFNRDATRIVTTSADKTAKVWDTRSGKEVRTLDGHSDQVMCASFSPDGMWIVTACADRTAFVWDANTGKPIRTLAGHKFGVKSASFNPDGTLIVTASIDGTAKVWDAKTGDIVLTLGNEENSMLTSASFNPDGTAIVTGSWDWTAKIWDVTSGELLHTFKGHEDTVTSVSFSPSGAQILTASEDRTVRVWDTRTVKATHILKHEREVNDASFSADGTQIITASDDGTARVWDATTGRELRTLRGHKGLVHTASFSPDGTRILTASVDGSAKVWDAKIGTEANAVRANYVNLDHTQTITSEGWTVTVRDARTKSELFSLNEFKSESPSATFSPDGTRIITWSSQDPVKVWNAQTGVEHFTLREQTNQVTSVSFSPDSKWIITTCKDTTLRVWDANTGNKLRTLNHEAGVDAASFSPDGSRIVTVSEDNSVKVWDTQTGAELSSLKGHTAHVHSAMFSADGARIITVDQDCAKVWDAKTGEEMLTLKGHTEHVHSALFSADGARIITVGWDCAKVWDAKNGAEMLTLKRHTGACSAAISADGMRIVTGSTDGTAIVWDAMSGAELLTLKGHTDYVNEVAFGMDGWSIVTMSSDDRTVAIWDARTGIDKLQSMLPSLPVAPMPRLK